MTTDKERLYERLRKLFGFDKVIPVIGEDGKPVEGPYYQKFKELFKGSEFEGEE